MSILSTQIGMTTCDKKVSEQLLTAEVHWCNSLKLLHLEEGEGDHLQRFEHLFLIFRRDRGEKMMKREPVECRQKEPRGDVRRDFRSQPKGDQGADELVDDLLASGLKHGGEWGFECLIVNPLRHQIGDHTHLGATRFAHKPHFAKRPADALGGGPLLVPRVDHLL